MFLGSLSWLPAYTFHILLATSQFQRELGDSSTSSDESGAFHIQQSLKLLYFSFV